MQLQMKKATWATSRPKSSHYSLQGSKSTNLLANSSYNIESNNVEDDDLVLLIRDKTTSIVFLPHQVSIMKKLLLNARVEDQGLSPKMVILGKETSKLERKAQALADNLQDRVMAFEK
jgi:hypothetical protein